DIERKGVTDKDKRGLQSSSRPHRRSRRIREKGY
ncbi:unnamed protein product, partial [marine sediment metagenome]